jgi:hypothetical protein
LKHAKPRRFVGLPIQTWPTGRTPIASVFDTLHLLTVPPTGKVMNFRTTRECEKAYAANILVITKISNLNCLKTCVFE